MSGTSITRDGDVAVLRLDEGRGNALSSSTIEALARALDDVEQSGARAVMLTGRGKVFSAGLDLRACARFNRAEMVRYVDAFEALFERVFSYRLPMVAAVNGAAIAGGAVIALACDLRVMAPGAVLGLNEVELGLPFPSMALEIARFGVPPASHADALLLGRTFSAADAVARGIAHAEGGDDEALSRAREFLARGTAAVGTVKLSLRAGGLSRARREAIASRRAFVDAFFSDDAQARIRGVVAKLEKR